MTNEANITSDKMILQIDFGRDAGDENIMINVIITGGDCFFYEANNIPQICAAFNRAYHMNLPPSKHE